MSRYPKEECLTCEEINNWEARHRNEDHLRENSPLSEEGDMIEEGDDDDDVVIIEETNKAFVCPYDGAEFTNVSHLLGHLVYHAVKKRKLCLLCKKVLCRPESLINHLLMHRRKVKQFGQCPVCDRRFGLWRGERLARHIRKKHPCILNLQYYARRKRTRSWVL